MGECLQSLLQDYHIRRKILRFKINKEGIGNSSYSRTNNDGDEILTISSRDRTEIKRNVRVSLLKLRGTDTV